MMTSRVELILGRSKRESTILVMQFADYYFFPMKTMQFTDFLLLPIKVHKNRDV